MLIITVLNILNFVVILLFNGYSERGAFSFLKDTNITQFLLQFSIDKLYIRWYLTYRC